MRELLGRCSQGGFMILGGLLFHLQHPDLGSYPFSLGLALDKFDPMDEDRKVGGFSRHGCLSFQKINLDLPREATSHKKRSCAWRRLAVRLCTGQSGHE